VIGDRALEPSEPEKGELIEDAPLIRNPLRHDHVESGESIGGDDQQLGPQIVDVPDFPRRRRGRSRDVVTRASAWRRIIRAGRPDDARNGKVGLLAGLGGGCGSRGRRHVRHLGRLSGLGRPGSLRRFRGLRPKRGGIRAQVHRNRGSISGAFGESGSEISTASSRRQ